MRANQSIVVIWLLDNINECTNPTPTPTASAEIGNNAQDWLQDNTMVQSEDSIGLTPQPTVIANMKIPAMRQAGMTNKLTNKPDEPSVVAFSCSDVRYRTRSKQGQGLPPPRSSLSRLKTTLTRPPDPPTTPTTHNRRSEVRQKSIKHFFYKVIEKGKEMDGPT